MSRPATADELEQRLDSFVGQQVVYGWNVVHRMQGAAVIEFKPKRHLASNTAGGLLLLGPLGALAGAAIAGSPLAPRRVQVWVDNAGRIYAKGC